MRDLRDGAARWLQGRGIQQWIPGEVSLGRVEAEVRRGEWFVVRHGPEVIAAVRLSTRDDEVWGPRTEPALYVHGLVIDRRHAGRRLGAGLLRWAEAQARTAGARFLRLDCGAGNPALRRYYARFGFREVGCRRFADPTLFPAVLLEKPLAQSSRTTSP